MRHYVGVTSRGERVYKHPNHGFVFSDHARVPEHTEIYKSGEHKLHGHFQSMTDPRTLEKKHEKIIQETDSLDRLDGLKSPQSPQSIYPYVAYTTPYYQSYYSSPYYASPYYTTTPYQSHYYRSPARSPYSHPYSHSHSYVPRYKTSQKYESPQDFLSAIKRRETLVGKMYANGSDVYEVCRTIKGTEECRFVNGRGTRVSRHRFRHL